MDQGLGKTAQIQEVFLRILGEDSRLAAVESGLAQFRQGDWEKLCNFSVDCGLFPVFYARLASLNLKNFPAQFLTRLKDLYIFNLKKNLTLERELFRILEYFQASDIPVIPLKGPVLARFLYNDLAYRRASCDLDLLVDPGRLTQAELALERSGYICFNKNRRHLKLKYSNQLSFRRYAETGEAFLVDLHCDLRDLYAHSRLKDFQEGLREFNLEGHKLLMPSNEELLIYLCLAAMSVTEFIELRCLYDICALVSKFKEALNWQAIAKKLEFSRHRSCVFFALSLSQELFKFSLPQGFLGKIKPNFLKRFLLRFWISRKNALKERPRASLSRYYFFTAWRYFASSLLYSKNSGDCLKIIYKKIFLPKEEMDLLYGRASSFSGSFLYALRILKPLSRLFGKGKMRVRPPVGLPA